MILVMWYSYSLSIYTAFLDRQGPREEEQKIREHYYYLIDWNAMSENMLIKENSVSAAAVCHE